MSREDVLRLLQLLHRLEALSGPDRRVDHEIAEVVGWKPKPEGDTVVWLHPGTAEIARVPRYTAFLDEALQLAIETMPHHSGGIGWEPGTASARIGAYPSVQAVTPVIALCIAALQVKKDIAITNLRGAINAEKANSI